MTEQPLEYVLLYVGLAVAYALAGYLSNVLQDPAVSFSPTKFGTTLLVGVVAGGIMASQGEEASFGEVEAAMAISIPVVDKLLAGATHYRSDSSAAE